MENIHPYEILGVSSDSNKRDIVVAYRKKCLKYHPDKAPGKREEFDKIQLAYLVLSDERKRERYDKTGVVSVKEVENDENFDWREYFQTQFKEVTKDMIVEDKKQYQNSEEELDDIRDEIIDVKGNVEKLFERIPHLEFSKEEEERVYGIIEKLIEKGELKDEDIPQFSKYTSERKQRVKKMERKALREKKAADKYVKDEGCDSFEELARKISENRNRQNSTMQAIMDKYSSEKVTKGKVTKKKK